MRGQRAGGYPAARREQPDRSAAVRGGSSISSRGRVTGRGGGAGGALSPGGFRAATDSVTFSTTPAVISLPLSSTSTNGETASSNSMARSGLGITLHTDECTSRVLPVAEAARGDRQDSCRVLDNASRPPRRPRVPLDHDPRASRALGRLPPGGVQRLGHAPLLVQGVGLPVLQLEGLLPEPPSDDQRYLLPDPDQLHGPGLWGVHGPRCELLPVVDAEPTHTSRLRRLGQAHALVAAQRPLGRLVAGLRRHQHAGLWPATPVHSE